jgi:hypothetical protein
MELIASISLRLSLSLTGLHWIFVDISEILKMYPNKKIVQKKNWPQFNMQITSIILKKVNLVTSIKKFDINKLISIAYLFI